MIEFPIRKQEKPKREQDECEIKIRRDSSGRIIGIKRKGRCTKEDVLAFSKENNIEINEDG